MAKKNSEEAVVEEKVTEAVVEEKEAEAIVEEKEAEAIVEEKEVEAVVEEKEAEDVTVEVVEEDVVVNVTDDEVTVEITHAKKSAKDMTLTGLLNANRKATKFSLILNIITAIIFISIGIGGLFFHPLQSAGTLAEIFGFILVFIGINFVLLGVMLVAQKEKFGFLFFIYALISGAVGVLLITNPATTAVNIAYYIAFLMLIKAIIKLMVTKEDWLFSILLILSSIAIIIYPTYFVVWGVYFIFITLVINGIYTIGISVKALTAKPVKEAE